MMKYLKIKMLTQIVELVLCLPSVCRGVLLRNIISVGCHRVLLKNNLSLPFLIARVFEFCSLSTETL
jgi:hypothetical protein